MNVRRPVSSAVLMTVVSLLGSARAKADGSITGWVHDELNDPIVGVWVDAYAPSGEWASSGFSQFDGEYEIAGLSNGEYFVRTFVLEGDFLDEWYDDVPVAGWEIPAAATPILVADGIASNINFVLSSGGAITGRVTELTGGSVSNVWVDAYDLSGSLVKSAITETDGTYRLGGLPAGWYYLRTAALGLNRIDEWFDDIPVIGSEIPATAELVTVPAGVTTGPCNFALAEGAIIQGRVTDESGYPLGGIWVDAYEESGVWLKSAITATDGRYVLEGLPVVSCCTRTYTSTGNYADEWYDNVSVRGFEIPLEAQRFALASGLVFSNVDFALSPGASVSGTVTDSAAQPLAGAQVHAYSSAMEWIRSVSTDGGGQYSIQRLPAGSYFVRTEAGAMGFADEWFDDVPVICSGVPEEAVLITLTTGEARTNMNFVLPQAGTIEGMVSGSQGALSNVAMHLFDSRTNRINTAISDSSGNYSATGLHPAKLFWIRTDTGSNNYADEWFDNVSLVARGIPVEAQPVAVTPGGVTSNINFLLAEGGTLRGSVRDACGSPITNIWVNLFRSNLTWLASGQTDAAGRYEITKLASDSVFVRTYSAPFAFEDKWHPNAPANSPEIPPDAQPVVVSSGIATNVDFTLGFWIAGCGVTHRHVRIVWQAASGTTYFVSMSTNLVTWASAPNGTNAVQQNTRTSTEQSFLEYEDPIPLDMPRFYRVEIAL